MTDDHTLARSTRPPLARWLWRLTVLAIVMLGMAVIWWEHTAILRNVAAAWVVSDTPSHADAIVVLGGDLDVRPFAAAALYKQGFADKVLVSNVRLTRAEALGFIPSHTELNREVLLHLGVPASAIETFGESLESTHAEAEAARDWALATHAKRVIIPTELFAARRTRWIFNTTFGAAGLDPIVVALPSGAYKLANWWRYRAGVVDFNNEILKYLYYRIYFG